MATNPPNCPKTAPDKGGHYTHIHAAYTALAATESSEWNTEEKCVLTDMLQEWATQLMALDARDLRKQLKLAVLRGKHDHLQFFTASL